MKLYICSSVIMLAFASERSGAARKLVGAMSGIFLKWPERGAKRGAGCNRKGLSDGSKSAVNVMSFGCEVVVIRFCCHHLQLIN